MQGIANLAGVERPAVTQWRRRYPVGSSTPFPNPLANSAAASMRFDALKVAKWLVDTDHGNNPEAVEDAALHSHLFDNALDDPQVWLALAVHALIGDEVTDAAVRDYLRDFWWAPSNLLATDFSDAASTANALAEAAYSPVKVLKEIVRQRRGASAEGLLLDADALFAALGAELVRSLRPGVAVPEVVSHGPGAQAWAVRAAEAQEASPSITFTSSSSTPNSQIQTLTPEFCLSVALGLQVEEPTDDFDPAAIGFVQWASATGEDAKSFFDLVAYVQDGLDPRGCAVILGPADLLVESQSQAVNIERKNFLWGAKNNLRSPLRYSALLPHGWTRNLGQRQLALWVLRAREDGRPDSDLVVLADCSSLTFDDVQPRQFVSDVLAAVDGEVSPRQHSFRNGRVVPDDAVRRQDSLRPARDHAEVIQDSASLASLRDQAAGLGLDASLFDGVSQSGNPYELHRKRLMSLEVASRQPAPLVRVISGSRLQDVNVTNPDGSIPVVGRSELAGVAPVGSRTAAITEIGVKLPSSTLTEPGDVICVFAKQPFALVDVNGGYLVESPAFILRPLRTQGRTKVPLDEVTSPHLLAQEVRRAATKNRKTWMVPVLSRQDADIFEEMMRAVEARRAELLRLLERLDDFGDGVGRAVASGGIRADPG